MSSSVTLGRREKPLKLDYEGLQSLDSHRIWWGRHIIYLRIAFFISATVSQVIIYCTGTLRSNRRNFPPDLKDVAKCGLATRGDMMARQDGNVSVCVTLGR